MQNSSTNIGGLDWGKEGGFGTPVAIMHAVAGMRFFNGIRVIIRDYKRFSAVRVELSISVTASKLSLDSVLMVRLLGSWRLLLCPFGPSANTYQSFLPMP